MSAEIIGVNVLDNEKTVLAAHVTRVQVLTILGLSFFSARRKG